MADHHRGHAKRATPRRSTECTEVSLGHLDGHRLPLLSLVLVGAVLMGGQADGHLAVDGLLWERADDFATRKCNLNLLSCTLVAKAVGRSVLILARLASTRGEGRREIGGGVLLIKVEPRLDRSRV